jgi:hypothetical protein
MVVEMVWCGKRTQPTGLSMIGERLGVLADGKIQTLILFGIFNVAAGRSDARLRGNRNRGVDLKKISVDKG